MASLHHLLDDVLDLARLHSGRENRRVSEIDVSALLTEFVDDLQGYAELRGPFFRQEGPTPFVVEGDAIKDRRVVLNS